MTFIYHSTLKDTWNIHGNLKNVYIFMRKYMLHRVYYYIV